MRSSFVPPERNVIPNQGTSPSFPGNTGAADSSQPGRVKKFFSRKRNIVLLVVAVIILSSVLGRGAKSGWFSGDSGDEGKRSDVPETPPPHSEPEIPFFLLNIQLHTFFQSPNTSGFDFLVKFLREENVTNSTQLEQVFSHHFKEYPRERYSPEVIGPKIEKLRWVFNTDRTLKNRIHQAVILGEIDSLLKNLNDENVLDSDVQSAVENLNSDYELSSYQRKQLAEFDFSFRGQSSKSLYFDRMFDLYTTNYSDQSTENLFKDLSRFLDPSVIKEETTRYRERHPYSPLLEGRLISLEKMCESAVKGGVYLKKSKERDEKYVAEASRIITKVLDSPDRIVYDDVLRELSNKISPLFISLAASKFQKDFGKRKNYFLSYLKYYFGHKSLSKHILEAIEIYTKGLTPNAVPNDLWDELQSHFGNDEILKAIDELKTSQSNPQFEFLVIKCGRLSSLSFPDIHQAILDHLKKTPHRIGHLVLELAEMGANLEDLFTAIKEFEYYESPNAENQSFILELRSQFRDLIEKKNRCHKIFCVFRDRNPSERSKFSAIFVKELSGKQFSRYFDYPTTRSAIKIWIQEASEDFQYRLFLVDVLREFGKLSDKEFLSDALSVFKDSDSPQELYNYLKSNLKNIQDLQELAESLESYDEYKDILKALLEISNESYKFDSIREFLGKENAYDQNLKDLFEDWFKNFRGNFSADIKKLIIFANSDEWKTPYQKNEVKNLVLLIFSLLYLGREDKIGEYLYNFTFNYIDEYILPNALTFFSLIFHDHEHDYRYLKEFGVVTDKDCFEISTSLNLLKIKFFPEAPPSIKPLPNVIPHEPSPTDTKPAESTVSKNPEVSFPYDCSICLEFLGGPHTSITKCGHIFCKSCIDPIKSKPCPNCRTDNPDPLPLKNVRVEKKDVEGKEEIKIYVSCSSESCKNTKPENLKKFFTLICDRPKHTNRNVYCESCADNLLKKECPDCKKVPSKIKIFEVEEKKNK